MKSKINCLNKYQCKEEIEDLYTDDIDWFNEQIKDIYKETKQYR